MRNIKSRKMYLAIVMFLILFTLPINAAEILNAEQWYDKGNDCQSKKDYDKAILAYSNAIELSSKYKSAYNDRGVAYIYKKNTS